MFASTMNFGSIGRTFVEQNYWWLVYLWTSSLGLPYIPLSGVNSSAESSLMIVAVIRDTRDIVKSKEFVDKVTNEPKKAAKYLYYNFKTQQNKTWEYDNHIKVRFYTLHGATNLRNQRKRYIRMMTLVRDTWYVIHIPMWSSERVCRFYNAKNKMFQNYMHNAKCLNVWYAVSPTTHRKKSE